MTNFHCHHRPDIVNIESILIEAHNNFIDKKEPTERIILCKKLRNVHIGYTTYSNLNDCMKSIHIEYIQRLAAHGIVLTTNGINIAWETTRCNGREMAMAMLYSPQEKAMKV